MLSRGTGCSVVIVKVEAHVFGRGEARRSSRNHVCDLPPWIRTEGSMIFGFRRGRYGQEQAYGSADHRCAEAG